MRNRPSVVTEQSFNRSYNRTLYIQMTFCIRDGAWHVFRSWPYQLPAPSISVPATHGKCCSSYLAIKGRHESRIMADARHFRPLFLFLSFQVLLGALEKFHATACMRAQTKSFKTFTLEEQSARIRNGKSCRVVVGRINCIEEHHQLRSLINF